MEIRIKTTMIYHFPSIRMATINKTNTIKKINIGKDVEKTEPLCIAGGMENGTDVVETV